MVLLPESVAAVRAALANRLQTSLNLGLGSALATIGLTIPAVAALSLMIGLPIALGLDTKSMVLLFLTLMVTTLTLGTGGDDGVAAGRGASADSCGAFVHDAVCRELLMSRKADVVLGDFWLLRLGGLLVS